MCCELSRCSYQRMLTGNTVADWSHHQLFHILLPTTSTCTLSLALRLPAGTEVNWKYLGVLHFTHFTWAACSLRQENPAPSLRDKTNSEVCSCSRAHPENRLSVALLKSHPHWASSHSVPFTPHSLIGFSCKPFLSKSLASESLAQACCCENATWDTHWLFRW